MEHLVLLLIKSAFLYDCVFCVLFKKSLKSNSKAEFNGHLPVADGGGWSNDTKVQLCGMKKVWRSAWSLQLMMLYCILETC